MTFYPTFWKQEGDGGDEDHYDDSLVNDSAGVSISVSSNGANAGPKRGFTDTAGKTRLTYEAYVIKMGQSRVEPNAEKWSDRLLLAARQVANSNKKAAEPPPVMTIAPSTDFLLYAPVMCDFPEDMRADDDDEFGGTEGAVMVPV